MATSLQLLQTQIQKVIQRFSERYGSQLALNSQEQQLLASSDFICDTLLCYPEWLHTIRQQPVQPQEWQDYPQKLQSQLKNISDENALMRQLRLFRRENLMRIAWAQACQTCTTEQSLQQLTALAETLIIGARDWLYQTCCHEWGIPCNHQGEQQPLLILGMGKLGGGELNFSSDIDLIFAYPENGQTEQGRRQLDNAQFFTRLGQRLIKVLSQPTVDGFVYRVDMRLRPFGDSGPLVMSFAALEDYYQEQGRDWERYAMIKARLMGGTSCHYSQELHSMLRPFIFRRYIDFSVIHSLRKMKAMIAREVRQRNLTDNIKLGAGGIREIEFIVQVFQLIRGGREPTLQKTALLPTLQQLAKLKILSSSEADTLRAAYLFLRRLENLLQAINDQQTQTLPQNGLDQARLAAGMGFSQWAELFTTLTTHMQTVHTIFNALIGDDEPEAHTNPLDEKFSNLWQDIQETQLPELITFAPQLSAEQHHEILCCLDALRQDLAKRTIGPRGRTVLDQLMPQLLAQTLSRPDAATVLPRLTPLLLSISSRTTYLELLVEYPNALSQLIKLCAASPMITNQLTRHPLLLDELLDPTTLYHPLQPIDYQSELQQYLLRIAEDDEEQRLNALRQFKQTMQLRIAAADISAILPVMKVSDHLTYLAESIIAAVVTQAWLDMQARYGRPAHLAPGEQGFAVVGYGKLGGWELGYSSDLDLVFLIDCPAETMTDGERAINGRLFYLRLAQRIMHIFSTRTAAGTLYDIDARLRPSGAAGMLVSPVEAFADYQRTEAWTWEHQALVRARVVYGGKKLHQRFDEIRHEILSLQRDSQQLKEEVSAMRQKMLHHHGQKKTELFDIKADSGGITDIEFIAQYLVLHFAHLNGQLTRWSDNVRIFASMAECGIMPQQEAQMLTQAYVKMRNQIHHLALQEQSSTVSANLFASEREQVQTSWHKWLA